jgi:hypothetical protein
MKKRQVMVTEKEGQCNATGAYQTDCQQSKQGRFLQATIFDMLLIFLS